MKFKRSKAVKVTGITGSGEDYSIYNLSKTEAILSITVAFAAFFAGSLIMFESVPFSAAAGIIGTVPGLCIGKRIFRARRDRAVLLQFRSFLDSLCNAFSAGCNLYTALKEACSGMKFIYGEKACIVKELEITVNGIKNGFTAEELLDDWQKRMHCDSISVFAETMIVSIRSGGNLGRAAADCREILSEKIETEMEIKAAVASGRNELNILSVMPFVITALMKLMGGSGENTWLDIGVKAGALAIFTLAYIIGLKITDIKV